MQMPKLKNLFLWLDKHGEEILILPLFGIITLMLFIEVPKRYLFGLSSPYVDEVARIMFIWCVFIGVPYAMRAEKHILIDLLPQNMPEGLSFILSISVNVISLIFCIFIVFYGYQSVQVMMLMGINTDALELPKGWFMMAIPIGFAGGALRCLQSLYILVRERQKKKRSA